MSKAQDIKRKLSINEKYNIDVKERGDILKIKVSHQYDHILDYKALGNLLLQHIRKYATDNINEIIITIISVKKHQFMRVFKMISNVKSRLKKEWKMGDHGMDVKYMPDYVVIDMQREGFYR